jgi:hypothetical protein
MWLQDEEMVMDPTPILRTLLSIALDGLQFIAIQKDS